MTLLTLFFSFVQVGVFSIGGGLAALPLIQHQTVELHSWLTLAEFTDLITIAQMTPGPIAINSATFVGTRVAGFPGAIIATFGYIFPSIVIVSLLAFFYYKYRELSLIKGILEGLRPAVVALIGSAGFSILILALWNEGQLALNQLNIFYVVLFVGALVLLRKTKLSPVLIMFIIGVIAGLKDLFF